jgi:hypothetical protein
VKGIAGTASVVPSENVKVAEPSSAAFQAQDTGFGTATVTAPPELEAVTPAPVKLIDVAVDVSRVPSSDTEIMLDAESSAYTVPVQR